MRWIWPIALVVAVPAFAQNDSYETPAYQPQPTPKYNPAPVVKLDKNYGLPAFGTVDAFVDKQQTQAPVPGKQDQPDFFAKPSDHWSSLDKAGADPRDETSSFTSNDDAERADTGSGDDDDEAAVKALDQVR